METEKQTLFQESSISMEIGTESGLKSLEKIKESYDQYLIDNDYSNVKYYIIKIRQVPEIMCSSAKYPVYDFQGNKLQDLSDLSTELDSFTFSIFASDTGGVIVFAWINENHGACTNFVKSLDCFTDDDIPHAIFRFSISYFENIYFSPTWWENLERNDKEYIHNRFVEVAHPMLPYRDDFLVDDGKRLIAWEVLSRETNAL